MIYLRQTARLFTLCFALAAVGRLQATPIISEFMATNDTTVADQDGDYADWLEIYNPGPTAVNLGGWYLTNKAGNLNKWMVPAVTLQSGGYLVVFCSEKNYTDPSAPLATTFNLSASGGFVALVEPDGQTIASSYTFPIQYPDISYGVSQPTGGGEVAQIGYFETATPGAANGNHANILLTSRAVISAPAGVFTASTTVSLSGAAAGQHLRYVLTPSSGAGDAVAPPNGSSTLYTGPITISATELLQAAVFSADDSQRGLPAKAMYEQLDTSSANRLDTFSSTLPLVVFDDNGYGLLVDDDIYRPAWIGAFSPGSGGTATLLQTPDFFTSDTMKLHGFSSANSPKQSYDADLSDDLGQDLPEPFLGLDSDKSWTAVSPWYYDRTYIHNSFVYSLGRSLGYWEPGTKFAEMFIHSSGGPLDYTAYSGITTITDRLKVGSNRIDIFSIDPSDITLPNVSGGYILRIDHPETDLYTWTTSQGITVMVDTPKLDVIAQPQINYITTYVQQMEDAMNADQASNYATRSYQAFIDQASWLDYHLINVFVENVDAFQFSEYFTKDVNGLIKAGPLWDYDRCMGSADGRDLNPQQWTPSNDGDFWNIGWWEHLTHDPDFMQAWVDRWQSLRLTVLSNAGMTGLVDSLAAQVGPEAAARDAARWPDDASRYPGNWSGEIAAMKSWLTTRAQWIDSQFVPAPVANASTTQIAMLPPTGAVIAYTLDGSDPRLPGGGMSSSAVLAAGPVILPAGQRFLARSYNASMVGVYPGSPWSSPLNAAAASANPPGQLTNVSARAFVGTGSQVLVVGFVAGGSTSKEILIRGVGPALTQYAVSGALAAPQLTLFDSASAAITTDSGWGNPAAPGNSTVPAGIQPATTAIFNQVYAFALPSASPDCALVATLPPASYTAQVSGVNGTTGVALAELYDADTGASPSPLLNLSARAFVGTGSQVLVAGFVVSGATPRILLIRAIGPTLSNYSVSGVLANPELTLYDSSGAVIATNTGWGNPSVLGVSTVPAGVQPATAAVFSQVSAYALPANSADCAMVVTLPPGAYTAQVNGVNSTTGVALVELYDVLQSP